MPLRWMWVAWLATAASACTPALDWREVRPEGSGALALFPCKPSRQAREVELSTAKVTMTVHACKAGDMVFAIAFADLASAQQVAPALAELRAAAARNVDAATPSDAAVPSIAGSTPNTQAARLRLAGRRADGSSVHEELAVFARGTRVFQATMLGGRLDVQAVQTFFESLRVTR